MQEVVVVVPIVGLTWYATDVWREGEKGRKARRVVRVLAGKRTYEGWDRCRLSRCY
jgi:hypothetical protein